MKKHLFFIILIFIVFAGYILNTDDRVRVSERELNVYSARKEHLIKPLLDRFSEESNVTINLVTGKGDALLTRLKSEGSNSPADVLITVDAGRLYRAQEAGVLRSIESQSLNQLIPSYLRSGDNKWFGLSIRARVIVYAMERVKSDQLDTYESLADPSWKGRICVRSSSNIYNQSLVASMLASQGIVKTEAWIDGLVENFARSPSGGDRDQIKAVAAGQCDVAIVNSYYLGGMLKSQDQSELAAANSVGLHWPNQNDRGSHINISGAGVTTYSKSPDLATDLIKFLATDSSQEWYANVNNEFPVRPGVKISDTLLSWGSFKSDQLSVSKLGSYNTEAIKTMDRAGWK